MNELMIICIRLGWWYEEGWVGILWVKMVKFLRWTWSSSITRDMYMKFLRLSLLLGCRKVERYEPLSEQLTKQGLLYTIYREFTQFLGPYLYAYLYTDVVEILATKYLHIYITIIHHQRGFLFTLQLNKCEYMACSVRWFFS